MSDRKTDNETLVSALRTLSVDIQIGDGIANACIAEAADRIEELATGDAIKLLMMFVRDSYKSPTGSISKKTGRELMRFVARDNVLSAYVNNSDYKGILKHNLISKPTRLNTLTE